MNKLFGTAIVSAFLAASGVSLALAQTANSPQSRHEAGAGRHFEQHAFARPTERIEARLAYVKTALKITDAQQPQWDAYANLVRKSAQEVEQKITAWRSAKGARPEHQRANAVERLEREQSFHAQAVTRINELLAVEKPLYAALSPEQQKVADEVLVRSSGHRKGRSEHGDRGFGRG